MRYDSRRKRFYEVIHHSPEQNRKGVAAGVSVGAFLVLFAVVLALVGTP